MIQKHRDTFNAQLKAWHYLETARESTRSLSEAKASDNGESQCP